MLIKYENRRCVFLNIKMRGHKMFAIHILCAKMSLIVLMLITKLLEENSLTMDAVTKVFVIYYGPYLRDIRCKSNN